MTYEEILRKINDNGGLEQLSHVPSPKLSLIQINEMIANSVEREEYEYWCARRDQFYEEGIEAVNNTVEDDIEEGISSWIIGLITGEDS